MKFALAQINPTIGDCAGNTRLIQREIERATTAGVELVVFPELAVTGYPPQDLLDTPALAERSAAALKNIAAGARPVVIVGFVEKNPEPFGRPYFNSAALIRNGKVEAVYRKHLLPSYDVFDEERYFEPGTENLFFELGGKKFAITICEDIWNSPGFLTRPYRRDSLEAIRKEGVDWVINLSASPFHLGKPGLRKRLLETRSRDLSAGILFCNQVGANDDLIFDGLSCVVDSKGRWMAEGAAFQSDLVMVDSDGGAVPTKERGDGESLVDALALGISDYVRKTSGKGVVLGLSGGIDSSVVAALAVKALGPDRVRGLLLPTRFTSNESTEDALFLAKALGIQTMEVSVDALYEQSISALKGVMTKSLSGIALENIQPRLRMTMLMAVANEENLLLLNTSNKSELAAGYATLYGDSAGALAVLGDVTKAQVYAMGKEFNRAASVIPKRVFERAPTAELREGQKDEDSLPPYSTLDRMVADAVENHLDAEGLIREGYSKENVEKFQSLYRQSEYKRRQFPPILRVSSHAFGRGRRIPVASVKPW